MSKLGMNPEIKVMSLKKASAWRNKLQRSGRKLVITNGCFDILHRGHAEYLSRARKCGDALLIAINSDASVRAIKGKSRPIVCEKDRAYLLASLIYVDAVVIFNTARCTDLFLALKPDIYVKGGDYNIDNIDKEEKAALLSVGSKIKFIKFIPGLSTTEILKKIAGK
ncbi:MAG: adenylyltransferase/cytidyltransferase family protein [Victivallales bacterium]|jgi:rfaE bifunctional protein nucleotidyltransferase chain/domain